jgi:ABC-2 type transport system permease protein
MPLLAFTLTAFGVMMAARITQFQAFMALTQMLVMPFFLSGALYPYAAHLVERVTRIDPLTYVVGPMRPRCSHMSLSPIAEHVPSPNITRPGRCRSCCPWPSWPPWAWR